MTSESENSSTASFSFVKFVDDNVRYIKYPFFGAGIIGAVLIARSVRMGTKFTGSKSIPEEFFKKQFTLNGNILEVCKGSGPLVSNSLNTATKEQELTLLVDHVPIFTLPVFFRNVWQPDTKSGPPGSNKLIRVTIPGLEIKTQFYYDIQSRLIGQRASMILMGRSKDLDTAYALVNLKCYKLKVFPSYESIGHWCVRNGFGAATAIPHSADFTNSNKFNAYYSNLLKFEEKAVRQRKGMWKGDQTNSSTKYLATLIKRLLKYIYFWKK